MAENSQKASNEETAISQGDSGATIEAAGVSVAATKRRPPVLSHPMFGPARLFNSSRSRQTRPAYRNRQPVRRRFIKYHEMGRGKQGKSGETRFRNPSTRPGGNVDKSQARKPNDRNAAGIVARASRPCVAGASWGSPTRNFALGTPCPCSHIFPAGNTTEGGTPSDARARCPRHVAAMLHCIVGGATACPACWATWACFLVGAVEGDVGVQPEA